jgi:hypothetical protein
MKSNRKAKLQVWQLNGIIASRNLYRRGVAQNERVIHAHLNAAGAVCVTGLYSEKSIPIAGEQFSDGNGSVVTV